MFHGGGGVGFAELELPVGVVVLLALVVDFLALLAVAHTEEPSEPVVFLRLDLGLLLLVVFDDLLYLLDVVLDIVLRRVGVEIQPCA